MAQVVSCRQPQQGTEPEPEWEGELGAAPGAENHDSTAITAWQQAERAQHSHQEQLQGEAAEPARTELPCNPSKHSQGRISLHSCCDVALLHLKFSTTCAIILSQMVYNLPYHTEAFQMVIILS